MNETRPDLDADMRAVEEMGGCVLPTQIGLQAALQWLAEQEQREMNWWSEEVPFVLAGIDASRRVLAALTAERERADRAEATLAEIREYVRDCEDVPGLGVEWYLNKHAVDTA
jgi:hypothetical protein